MAAITKAIQSIGRWFLLFFHIKTQQPAIVERATIVEKSEVDEQIKDVKQSDIEESGIWYNLSDLLDTLDDYFFVLKLYKKANPDGYNLYSKIGALILQRSSKFICVNRLPDNFLIGERPSFGCVHIKQEQENENLTTSFASFQKLDNKIYEIEPTDGDVYRMDISYFDKKKNRHLINEFYISLEANNKIRLLKQRVIKTVFIPTTTKIGKKRSKSGTHLQRIEMAYPWFLETLAKDQKARREITPQELAEEFFYLTTTAHYNASTDGFRVKCERGGMAATFHIDMLKTPYFFKSRDRAVNEKGRAKKIFHIVRVHERNSWKGKSYVRTHFRGLRRFMWKGYNVIISLPGLHHKNINTFDAKAYYEDDTTKSAKFVSMTQLANNLSSHLNSNTSLAELRKAL